MDKERLIRIKKKLHILHNQDHPDKEDFFDLMYGNFPDLVDELLRRMDVDPKALEHRMCICCHQEEGIDREVKLSAYQHDCLACGEKDQFALTKPEDAVNKVGVFCDGCWENMDGHVGGIPCQTCNKKKGEHRQNNGSKCGVHCDKCWDDMVKQSRQQSW